MFARWTSSLMIMAAAVMVVSTTGCGEKDKKADSQQAKAGKGDGKKDLKAEHSHDGWWCDEHGVPEDLCSLCSAKVAAQCKKEGDWCKIHDRAQSQCFKCDPAKYKKFEDMYVAKYGKAPERPPEEEFKK